MPSIQYLYITQEVQVDQTLPLGRIENPELMDYPKERSLFGLGLPGYTYMHMQPGRQTLPCIHVLIPV